MRTPRDMIVVLAVAASWGGACGDPISLDETDPDAQRGRDFGAADADAGEVDAGPATLAITFPAVGTELPAGAFLVVGEASSPTGMGAVFVSAGPNVAARAESEDGFRNWQVALPVGPGSFDVEGRSVAIAGPVPVSGPAQVVDARQPTVTIREPTDGESFPRSLVLLRGTSNDDRAVVAMQVLVDDVVQFDRPLATTDFYLNWSGLVALPLGRTSTVAVRAFDALGQFAEDTVTLTSRGIQDRDAPDVRIDAPTEAEVVDTELVEVRGTAADGTYVREVKVRWAFDGGEREWSDYVSAQTEDDWASWTARIAPPAGSLVVEARAIDAGGLGATDTVHFVSVAAPEYGEEETYFLRVRGEGDPPRMALELDREGVSAVMSEEIQRELLLMELAPLELLENTLDAVKDACGTSWSHDSPDPDHNCSLTPLGQTFRGSDGSWRTSAEYAMVRILTMTPANAQVAGTSIAGIQELADGEFFGITIGGGFSQILADSLGIDRTETFLSTDSTARALLDGVVATHPNTGDDGSIPVTLYDVMNDLAPLGRLLGPTRDHPGIVDPSVPPTGRVFGDDFRMVLSAQSNLQWRDGIDLSSGKDYFAVIVDQTGPTFDDVVEFDFTDPESFDLRGLVPEPTADIRFRIVEDGAFVESCHGRDACQGNLPGSPVGARSYWALPPWSAERIVADAGLSQYQRRRFRRCYIDFVGCHAEVAIGQDGAPSGWAAFHVILDLGDPPEDQYVWELIDEVAQVALHRLPDRTIPEGHANVAFSVTDIPVGLRASEVREIVRPVLQEQAPLLSEMLLGEYAANNGLVDLYYVHEPSGPALRFVGPDDPRPDAIYPYERPGFFGEPTLDELSRVSAPNEIGGETFNLPLGESLVWAQDDVGRIYRLRIEIERLDDPEIVVHVAERL